jgi:hypothetical protein
MDAKALSTGLVRLSSLSALMLSENSPKDLRDSREMGAGVTLILPET